MNQLPKWALANPFPAIHDFESLTVLEQTARIYGAMTALIDEYNGFADAVNVQLAAFSDDETEARKEFELQIAKVMKQFTCTMEQYLKTNLDNTARMVIEDGLESGAITIPTDAELRTSGKAADAKATGAAIGNAVSDFERDISVERARIDVLTANNQSATDENAELIDIRVSYDGNVHATAGGAVRDQIRQLNTNMREFGTKNLIPIIDGVTKEESGVTITAKDGAFTINGTTTATFGYNIAGAANKLPTDFVIGEEYSIDYFAGESYMVLRVVKFTEEDQINGTTICELRNSSGFKFTVPEDAKGIIVRLFCIAGRTFDNVTVKPIITKNASVAQLEEKVNKIGTYAAPGAMLTIIDDDGHNDFINEIVPIIEAKKVPIATAVVNSWIGQKTGYMTWENIMECCSRGAEVLCHSYDHNPTVPDVDELAHQYTIARNEMLRRGLPGGDILVYNNATGDTEVAREAASRVFKCAINSHGSNVYTKNTKNPYNIARYIVDERDIPYGVEYMKDLIDFVAENGGWMVWIIHTSGTNWKAHNGASAISEAIDYAKEKGVPIVSAENGFRKYIAT